MPRAKKPHLKRRKDGRFACRYRDQWFYGSTEEETLALRDDYKRLERLQVGAVPSLAEYSASWFSRAYPSVAESTKVGLRIHLRRLTDLFGSVLISDVKPSQIKTVYSSCYTGLSASYIKGAKQLYSSLFDSAVADGFLRSNPAREKSARPHKGTVGGHRPITQEERSWIETLCTDHRAWPAVMAMLYAGLRPQEMKALKIDRDVDFAAETITLREFVHVDGTRYRRSSVGKTEKAARVIPLLPPLKAALAGRSGYLITSASGQPVSIQAWRSAWDSYVSCMETAINGCQRRWYGKTKEHRAVLDAGGSLPPWRSFTVVPYDLRHSFCCMLRDADPPVEINTVIRWMGHADEKMVLRIYDSVSDDRSGKEAERLKKSLIRSRNGSQAPAETSGNPEK